MRTAPGADRTVAVLTAIGSDSGRGMTLSELVRRTGFPKGTCHAVLSSLTDAGWVLRHPVGPSYQLGPGLIALGQLAARGYPALPFAEDVMHQISDDLGVECLATAKLEDSMTVLAKTGNRGPLAVGVAVGQRLPLVPPLASVFVAWAPPAEVEALLADAGPARRKRYLDALAVVRDRGFAVGLESRALEAIGREMSRGRQTGSAPEVGPLLDRLDREDYQLIGLRASASYRVNHIAAPVFDASGAVTIAITAVGITGGITGREVRRIGARLCAGAEEVTAAIRGQLPVQREGKEMA